jgi:hypothetical protein
MTVSQSLTRRVSCLLHPAITGETPQASAAELKTYYAMLLIVFFIILVPIWIVDYPGMVDYPNHLARCYILAHYHDNPVLQQRYILDHSPIPNLAIDLIVTPLLRIIPLIAAGKIFLSIAAALYVLGCSAVGRAVTGKPNWLALVCAFTFYNSPLLLGFVNYIFGVGVFLCVFAFWLQVRNAMTPLRFFLCCLLSIAAFLAHLSAIVILGVACCTIALFDFVCDRRIRSLIVKLIWLACPLLLMVGFMKGSGKVGSIAWRPLTGKLLSLLAPVRSYSLAMDLGVAVVLLFCALPLLKGSKVHSAVAVTGLAFFILYAATPYELFTASGVDLRYVVPGFLLLALSIEPRGGPWQKAAIAVALAAMVIHTGRITASWLIISHRSEQVLAMGQYLPAGARIYAIESKNGLSTIQLDSGFVHIIEFWTISHGADISSLFAFPGQQPLVFRQPPCNVSERANPMWKQCLARYDYIWTNDPPTLLRQEILRVATPVAVWEKVTLWRVNRMSVSSTASSMDSTTPPPERRLDKAALGKNLEKASFCGDYEIL